MHRSLSGMPELIYNDKTSSTIWIDEQTLFLFSSSNSNQVLSLKKLSPKGRIEFYCQLWRELYQFSAVNHLLQTICPFFAKVPWQNISLCLVFRALSCALVPQQLPARKHQVTHQVPHGALKPILIISFLESWVCVATSELFVAKINTHGFNYHLISTLRKCLTWRGERARHYTQHAVRAKLPPPGRRGMSRWATSLVLRTGEKVLGCFIDKYRNKMSLKETEVLQPWLSSLLPVFIFPNRSSCGSATHDDINSTQAGLCNFQPCFQNCHPCLSWTLTELP